MLVFNHKHSPKMEAYSMTSFQQQLVVVIITQIIFLHKGMKVNFTSIKNNTILKILSVLLMAKEKSFCISKSS